jgi:hypothetical protein
VQPVSFSPVQFRIDQARRGDLEDAQQRSNAVCGQTEANEAITGCDWIVSMRRQAQRLVSASIFVGDSAYLI